MSDDYKVAGGVEVDQSIIIVGGGIAGLAAGCYGQMQGYNTKIFEMHNLPGGVCTSWKRKGYTIDGCIHWLVGSDPKSQMNRIWADLGVADLDYLYHDEYARVQDKSGKTFVIYADLDKLENHMKQLAPQDERIIDEFIKTCRSFGKMEMPAGSPENFAKGMKALWTMIPVAPLFMKWRKVTVAEYARRFSDPFIRDAFNQAFGGEMGMPVLAMMVTLGWLGSKNAGYPVGGSLKFAQTIAEKYRELGGEINYNSRVVEILVEKDRAVGVRLANGTEHRADWIVSAADGRTTIFDMLGGRYLDAKINGYYEQMKLFPPLVYVGIGVNRDFTDFPNSVTGSVFALPEPVTLGGKELSRLGVSVYNFDPSLAPAGKTVIKTVIEADYDWWKQLAQNKEAYEAEKDRIAETVVDSLDDFFPGLREQVEMVDVATPLTWERYTGNWRGAYEGWMITPETFGSKLPKTLPGLERFYMAGQWVEPGGGLPPAAMSGRDAIKLIAKHSRR